MALVFITGGTDGFGRAAASAGLLREPQEWRS
ncbi:NAD(P)-dependent dehydrogenase (short-subunit alcohol dehydrogenase family) [Bradyrhizobium diazoefficiens]